MNLSSHLFCTICGVLYLPWMKTVSHKDECTLLKPGDLEMSLEWWHWVNSSLSGSLPLSPSNEEVQEVWVNSNPCDPVIPGPRAQSFASQWPLGCIILQTHGHNFNIGVGGVGRENTEIRKGSFPDSSRILSLKKLTNILLGFAGLRRIAKALLKNPLWTHVLAGTKTHVSSLQLGNEQADLWSAVWNPVHFLGFFQF